MSSTILHNVHAVGWHSKVLGPSRQDQQVGFCQASTGAESGIAWASSNFIETNRGRRFCRARLFPVRHFAACASGTGQPGFADSRRGAVDHQVRRLDHFPVSSCWNRRLSEVSALSGSLSSGDGPTWRSFCCTHRLSKVCLAGWRFSRSTAAQPFCVAGGGRASVLSSFCGKSLGHSIELQGLSDPVLGDLRLLFVFLF